MSVIPPCEGQLDLFADTDEADNERAAAQARRDAWMARMIRADWIAPYDTASGMKKGDSVLGWQCPACGTIERNEMLLGINHNIHPHSPGEERWLTECTEMWFRRRKAGRHA